MLNGKLEVERPPILSGQPSGGQCSSLTSLLSLYSTGPHCPVKAIIRHTCLNPEWGPCPARLIWPTLHKVGQRPDRFKLPLGPDLPQPSSTLTLSGHVCHTWGRKAHGFDWVTFGWVSCKINQQSMPGRLEAKWHPRSPGPTSSAWSAALISLSPLHSTGPHCPV